MSLCFRRHTNFITWNDMTVLHVEIVMRSKNVAWNHRRKSAPMLLRITSVHHIDHPFGIAVPKVTIMRGS